MRNCKKTLLKAIVFGFFVTSYPIEGAESDYLLRKKPSVKEYDAVAPSDQPPEIEIYPPKYRGKLLPESSNSGRTDWSKPYSVISQDHPVQEVRYYNPDTNTWDRTTIDKDHKDQPDDWRDEEEPSKPPQYLKWWQDEVNF